MPSYCYSIRDLKGTREVLVERVFPMGKAPNHVTLDDGRRADRDLPAELADVSVSADYSHEIESSAVGWHPSQREEVMAAAKRDGVPLELKSSRDGSVLKALFRNPRQRRKVLKWTRNVDKDSYY